MMRAEAEQAFDLSEGPLVRAKLLRLDEEDHILLLIMHHIISDGWSMGVLVRELGTLYEAYTRGKTLLCLSYRFNMPIMPCGRESICKARSLSDNSPTGERGSLADCPVLELPTDRARPTCRATRSDAELSVSERLSEELRKLSQREGATLFMLLLAAFKVLLYRYTSEEDIIVGSPIAGRQRVETEGLIGFFVNTLVLRTKIKGNESFRELLKRVREETLEAYEHQDIPFEKLVEELQPERDFKSHAFVSGGLCDAECAAGGAGSERVEVEGDGGGDGDFEVRSDAGGGGARGQNQRRDGVQPEVMAEERIKRMVGHYERLLEAIVADPQQQISRLPLLTRGSDSSCWPSGIRLRQNIRSIAVCMSCLKSR